MDITSFEKIPAMIDQNEKSCTYPHFLRGPHGELIFNYRDGRSGNGDQYFNVYDPQTQTWRRLVDGPLFAGNGKRNAYFMGPVQDRKGVFHICWVWREKPDCATNHHLSYARSRDLVHWETSGGRPQPLPMTLENSEIVDPVPINGGILNGHTLLSFDSLDRPMIAYHKFDAQGNTQIYNARRESTGWKIYQASDWDYRWDHRGGGTIRVEVSSGPVAVAADGSLTQSYHHIRYGSGAWRLDPATLKPIAAVAAPKGPQAIEPCGIGLAGNGTADCRRPGPKRPARRPLRLAMGNLALQSRPPSSAPAAAAEHAASCGVARKT